MSKTNKTQAAFVAAKSTKVIQPLVDKLAQAVAVAFILATSYRYVQSWLATHQISQGGSVAAGIMVVSISVYLIIRHR